MVGGLIKPAEATQLAYLFFLEEKKKKVGIVREQGH